MMNRVSFLLKKAFTPVTIMVIPHGNLNALNLKIPVAGLLFSMALAIIGGGYLCSLAVNGLEYKMQHQTMARKIKFYSERFYQWDSTMTALRKVESEFRRIFDLGSKEEILENVDHLFAGSLDTVDLGLQLKKTIESVDEIKNYLRTERDMYTATPIGYPAPGSISSRFGKRIDPINGQRAFHSGIDISCNKGSEIRATADGVVSHSGWAHQSGYVVVLEHGFGFSTIYAHNTRNAVKVGQVVKRGEVIGYVGSTGKSTGPHVHYEVWKNGKSVDPYGFLEGRT